MRVRKYVDVEDRQPSLLAVRDVERRHRNFVPDFRRPAETRPHPASEFLVARRISSDSLGSSTARASTRAPTMEAAAASALSSRWRGFSVEAIRLLSKPITPRTPAVKRCLRPPL